jgi:hypothetical protein
VALIAWRRRVPAEPGFGLYYAAMLSGFIAVFFAFADAIVTGDG